MRLRVNTHVVRHNAHFADARPDGLWDESRDNAFLRRGSQALSGILGVELVVAWTWVLLRRSHRGLVGDDEDVAQPAKLLSDRSNEVVADEDVLVLLFDQLEARGHNYFHHVL